MIRSYGILVAIAVVLLSNVCAASTTRGDTSCNVRFEPEIAKPGPLTIKVRAKELAAAQPGSTVYSIASYLIADKNNYLAVPTDTHFFCDDRGFHVVSVEANISKIYTDPVRIRFQSNATQLILGPHDGIPDSLKWWLAHGLAKVVKHI
jgi:hypothetical protein